MAQQLPIQWRKGDVAVVSFPHTDANGKAQVQRRPALIISGNRCNDFLDDVLVVPVTTTKPRKFANDISIEILLQSDEGKRAGLKLDSIIDCTVIATMPKKLLISKLGSFSARVMHEVDECIKRCLEMDGN
jgi:mRNA-degrading endonuclease toxin of MazEF toxin-antitoxin module